MPELTVLTQPRNSGYAAALGRGLLAARYDPVLYTDADGQFDLADLGAAYRLLGDDVELVAGYREVRADPLPRRVAAAGFNALVRLLLGVRARDVDCAFKLFRRRFFDRVQLASDGFLIDTEIFARAERARLGIVQLPVRHRPRRAGRSTVRLRTVWTSWRQLLALRRRLRSEERLATRTHAERFV
jgi:dolichol-phosphate mannosyltransferase